MKLLSSVSRESAEMAKRYTLSFTRDQLLALADALEGYHTHTLTPDELTAHDNVTRRVFDAVSKSTANEIADLVFS